MLSIVHIGRDGMYIDAGFQLFVETDLAKNELICLRFLSECATEMKYVHTQNREEFAIQKHKDLKRLANRITSADLIVFHGIDPLQAALVQYLSPKVKILWIALGFEVYTKLPEYIGELYAEKTTAIASRHANASKRLIWNWWKSSIRSMLPFIGDRYFSRAPVSPIGFRKALVRADAVGITLPYEWQLIEKKTGLKKETVWFSYYPIQQTVGEALLERFVEGDGIWVGNSATPENNHIDAFYQLKEMGISNRLVICPLSYGHIDYAEQVTQSGRELWGENFKSLRDYMPRELYNEQMLQCSLFVMNHWRQQAFGNILTALWLGAKVYLSRRNPILQDLRNWGIHVFCVEEDLVIEDPEALKPLSVSDRLFNREILAKQFSKEHLKQELTKGLMNLLDVSK